MEGFLPPTSYARPICGHGGTAGVSRHRQRGGRPHRSRRLIRRDPHPRCHPDGPILLPRRGPTMNTTSTTTTTTTQKQNTAREGAASTATHANNKTRRRRSQKVGSRPPKTKPAPPTKKKQQQRKTIIRTHRRTTQDTSVDPKTFIQQKQQGSLLREFGPESDCVLETKEKKKKRERLARYYC